MTGVLIRRGKNHVKTKTQREHHATTEVEIGLMQLQAKGTPKTDDHPRSWEEVRDSTQRLRRLVEKMEISWPCNLT